MRVMRRVTVSAIAALCVVAGLGSAMSWSMAEEEKSAKHTIKEVMKIAHGKDSNLLQKVIKGEASDEEKKTIAGCLH